MNSEESNGKPKRRVRYKGSHPRTFKEKYKEQNPEKYGEDVSKIIQQGKTPAGTHRPICVNEILQFLQPQVGQTGFDATLGYGGHALEMLKLIVPTGRLFATDADPIEMPKTVERLRAAGYDEKNFKAYRMNFAAIDRVVAESGPFDFILGDLGLSSMQIDNPDRGFTFKYEGPLDLRLNPKGGISAAEFLKRVKPEELEEVLTEYSDEPYAELIADAICSAVKSRGGIETTTALRDIITAVLADEFYEDAANEIRKSCQRTFQAIRIAVNREFDVLEEFLEKIPDALKPGGRVAILTFHSGEDRRVKKSFQFFQRAGIFSEYSKEPIRPTAEECFSNPRAKPTKMRWAIKAE
jgi:16S rRNA (cytosine1402-N4)-methyltransferase